MIDPCAYTDQLSYQPGDTVTVAVDTESDHVTIELVRMIVADGSGMTAAPVPWNSAGRYATSRQETCIGSFLHAPATDGGERSSRFTIGAWIWSNRIVADQPQTLMEVVNADGPGAARLSLQDGILSFEGTGPDGMTWRAATAEPLIDGVWYLVAGTVDGEARVIVEPANPLYGRACRGSAAATETALAAGAAVTVAAHDPRQISYENGVARGQATQCFTGKIEAPFYAHAALAEVTAVELARGRQTPGETFSADLVAGWDLALRTGHDPNQARSLVPDAPPALVLNVPLRGVQGKDWTGRFHDFASAPAEYGAIHFHDRDLADAGWRATMSGPLPDDLLSGVYGVSITAPTGSDLVPIFVVPHPERRGRQPLAVLMPTFSYLAYANEQLYNGDLDFTTVTDAELDVSAYERDRASDPRLGLSMYDHHVDGSGVAYSSARRPILNMRFGQDMWLTGAGRGLAGDMYLIEWLERRGIPYEVITDIDLHLEGRSAVEHYAAVVTGAHPEYYSAAMLDALEEYRDNGGALVYLGGNGFYWVTEPYALDPLVIEIRRGYAGIRSWESLPGEVTLVANGRPGGLWRHRGRAPQRLVGIGFCAQGWGRSEPYHLSPAASEDAYKWIFDGVDEEPLGAYGAVMGGAAGDELDRADRALGTPPHAVILASSMGHTNFYQRVVEEVPMGVPDSTGGQQDPAIKADIVYFESPGGGRVFSTGSIAWSGALLAGGGDNGVSKVTENVLRAFCTRI